MVVKEAYEHTKIRFMRTYRGFDPKNLGCCDLLNFFNHDMVQWRLCSWKMVTDVRPTLWG